MVVQSGLFFEERLVFVVVVVDVFQRPHFHAAGLHDDTVLERLGLTLLLEDKLEHDDGENDEDDGEQHARSLDQRVLVVDQPVHQPEVGVGGMAGEKEG